VTQLLWLVNVIVVHPSLPVYSIRELVDYSKQNPGKLNYTAFASAQAVMQWIMNATGLEMTFVPFKGGPSGMQAFFGGQIHVMYLAVGNPGLVGQIKAGKMRALAMPIRNPLLPDVPSFDESGIPKFGFRSWIGVFVPAGVPKDAIAVLSREIAAIVRNPQFHSTNMIPMGFIPVGNTPEEFAKFVAEDRKDGAELARLAGTRVQ
jgi:tripartite-type tricarboxylate transporter receptor subunit TctC